MGESEKRPRTESPPTHESWKIRCICGAREDDGDESETWIGCDRCGDWQHNICMGITVVIRKMPKRYLCQDCAPKRHKVLLDGMDRGERPWEQRREIHKNLLAEESQSNGGSAGKKRKRSAEEPGEVEESRSSVLSIVPQRFELTETCHHYTRRNEVEPDIQKYFGQRHSIFSRYDEGIVMTDDAWFGVTPEPVAIKVSDDLAAFVPPTKTVLIDLFAGAGGNSIAFALSNRWSTIIAIEKDLSVIACAQHNAEIYGVYDQITWINDDCFTYLSQHLSMIDPSTTVVFASPPWGGPGYTSDEIFNLSTMQPYSVNQIHSACKNMDSALYLPRTSDLRQIARLAPAGKKVDVVQYCVEGASKALVAYIPGTSVDTNTM